MTDSGKRVYRTVCMDCAQIYANAHVLDGPASHGLCLSCYAERIEAVETSQVRQWLNDHVDELPVGRIVLDQDLRVIGYNEAEERLTSLNADLLMGKRFFEEVAPCMAAEELSVWCSSHVNDGQWSEKCIDWLLRLSEGDIVATLQLCVGRGRVLINVHITQ